RTFARGGRWESARLLPGSRRRGARDVEAELDPVGPEDGEAAGREDARDLFRGNLGRLREARREPLTVHLPRGEDDELRGPRGEGGDGPAHHLPVPLHLDLAHRHLEGDVVDVVPLPPHDEPAPREELPGLRLLAHLLGEDPERAPAREPRGPRLRVHERELARLPQGRLARLRALLHDDARGPVDVRVRVPIALLQVLPDEGVVRLRVPPAEDQEALRGEGPPVRLEPEPPRGRALRALRGPDRLLLGGPHLLLRVPDRLDDAVRLPQGLPAGLVQVLRVPVHVLAVVQDEGVEVPDRDGERALPPADPPYLEPAELAVLPHRFEHLLEEREVVVQEEGPRLGRHSFLPECRE